MNSFAPALFEIRGISSVFMANAPDADVFASPYVMGERDINTGAATAAKSTDAPVLEPAKTLRAKIDNIINGRNPNLYKVITLLEQAMNGDETNSDEFVSAIMYAREALEASSDPEADNVLSVMIDIFGLEEKTPEHNFAPSPGLPA